MTVLGIVVTLHPPASDDLPGYPTNKPGVRLVGGRFLYSAAWL